MNLTTLQQLCANLAGDPDQSRYSGKYVGQLNLAQQQFAADSKALYKDTSWTSVAGTASYALPSDFVLEDDVTYNGFPLKPVSRHTLQALYPGTDWTLLSDTPLYYMVNPEEAAKTITLIPNPVDALTLSMRYFPLPADVAAASDVILNSSTLMTQFHMAVAALGAWLILSFEIQTQEILDKKRELIKIYQDGVSKAIDTFGNTKSEPLRIRPK